MRPVRGALLPRRALHLLAEVPQHMEHAALAQHGGAEIHLSKGGLQSRAAIMDEEHQPGVRLHPRAWSRSNSPRQLASSSPVVCSQSSSHRSPVAGSTPYATSSGTFTRRTRARSRPCRSW